MYAFPEAEKIKGGAKRALVAQGGLLKLLKIINILTGRSFELLSKIYVNVW